MQIHDNKTTISPPQEKTNKSSLPKCPICGYTSNTIKEIEKHMKCHDDIEEDSMFNCTECQFQSMNKDQLIKHLVIKHDKYTCNSCNIICNGKDKLNIHILYICYNCEDITSSLRNLMKHINDSHGSQPCLKFSQNKCSKGQFCWYSHTGAEPSP